MTSYCEATYSCQGNYSSQNGITSRKLLGNRLLVIQLIHTYQKFWPDASQERHIKETHSELFISYTFVPMLPLNHKTSPLNLECMFFLHILVMEYSSITLRCGSILCCNVMCIISVKMYMFLSYLYLSRRLGPMVARLPWLFHTWVWTCYCVTCEYCILLQESAYDFVWYWYKRAYKYIKNVHILVIHYKFIMLLELDIK